MENCVEGIALDHFEEFIQIVSIKRHNFWLTISQGIDKRGRVSGEKIPFHRLIQGASKYCALIVNQTRGATLFELSIHEGLDVLWSQLAQLN